MAPSPHPIIKPLIRRYKTCKRCLIGCITSTRVHYRGDIRCDVLFVGDSPSEIDIALGEPMLGPPGKLLNTLIEESKLSEYRIAFTNAIICPPSETDGGRLRKPKKVELANCGSRLQEFIRLAMPTYIVGVGSVACETLTKLDIEHYSIIHPAAILRQEEQGDIDMRRTLNTLEAIYCSLSGEVPF